MSPIVMVKYKPPKIVLQTFSLKIRYEARNSYKTAKITYKIWL